MLNLVGKSKDSLYHDAAPIMLVCHCRLKIFLQFNGSERRCLTLLIYHVPRWKHRYSRISPSMCMAEVGELTLYPVKLIAQRLRVTNSDCHDIEVISRELCSELHLKRSSLPFIVNACVLCKNHCHL